MTEETLRFILQIAAVFLGGGSVQLLLFLLRRRSELRQLDTASDVNTSAAAANQAKVYETQVKLLQEDGAVWRGQVNDFQAKVDRLEEERNREHRDFARQLRDAHSENTRLATRLAQLQTDLDIAERQVTELRRRLGGAL